MLDENAKRLAQGPNHAAVTTLLKDGSPATHLMWVDADDDHILLNTEIGRAKFANIKRNPRVSVVIWDRDDMFNYVEVRGEVVDTVGGQEARDHIDKVNDKYLGGPYTFPIQTERVILKVAPRRVRPGMG